MSKIGMEALQLYCDWLNAMAWVKASGQPYFIGRTENADGTVSYRLDRRDYRA